MSGAFPSAGSTVYYNEEGEPLGWDNDSYYEPEYDPDLGMGDWDGPDWCRKCGAEIEDDPVRGEHCECPDPDDEE